MYTTEFKWGKELTSAEFEVINSQRSSVFNKISWDYSQNNFFLERLFCIIKDNNTILAFGMLIPIEILIENHKYKIWGISTILSIEKGKGYGKYLMQQVKEYAANENKAVVGSCSKRNTDFYRKCKCTIWENGIQNFIYINQDGEEIKENDDDVIMFFYDDKNNILKNAMDNNKLIYHYFPHW